MKPKGIPLGALWGFIIIVVYITAFVGIGVYQVLSADFMTFGWRDFLAGGAKTLVYLIGGVIVFIPVAIIALYFIIRDRNIIYTFKRHWPLFALGAYMFLPIIPGPIDEAIVGAICLGLDVMAKRWVAEQTHEVEGAARKQIE